jgi:hypothetical protein
MEPGRPTLGRTTPFARRVGRLVCCAAVLSIGCRSAQRYEGIEAELRTRERELAEARIELRNARQLNEIYERQHHGPPAGAVIANGGAPNIPLRDITLGRGTGGVDDDGRPGDETLQVVIVPKDDDGTAVKVPAKATVQAWAVGTDGIKTSIGRWEVSPEHLRKTWRSGLLSTGYFVPLQWQCPPGTERVRIAVRLTTLDGRPYETDRDVTVRPPGGVEPVYQPPPPLAQPPLPVPSVIGQPEELPPPTPAVRFKPPQPLPEPDR